MSEVTGDVVVERVVDETTPKGAWAFDGPVAAAFDDMLRRSIPQHDLMRSLVLDLGSVYVRPHTDVVDLGCSRGEAMGAFVSRFGATVRTIGLEVSEPMLAASKERFKGWPESVVSVRSHDLRGRYPEWISASLTLSVLTMQFVPIEHRQRLIRDVFRSTAHGGAFILVEKILGSTAEIDAVLVDRYLTTKAENGYTKDQIDRKRLALEGVLVPVTARWNEELLLQGGFRQVDCFWRCLNFAGWLAIKG